MDVIFLAPSPLYIQCVFAYTFHVNTFLTDQKNRIEIKVIHSFVRSFIHFSSIVKDSSCYIFFSIACVIHCLIRSMKSLIWHYRILNVLCDQCPPFSQNDLSLFNIY